MPSRRPSSAASIQSSRAVPGGVILRVTVLIRPSRLVVVPSISVGPLAASTTSACWAEAVRKRSTAITVPAPATPAGGQVGVGEVGERVGAEQDEHVDLAAGGGLQDAGGVEPSFGRHRGPAARP